MTPGALGAALRDLAEHGRVYLDSLDDAEVVAARAPVKTQVMVLHALPDTRPIYCVEEVTPR